ncbi:hypothetical protein PG630_10510 [Riemerella anatipestifer]|nr:hypothetical protein [Riemerella anatipestifer]
MKIYFTYRTGYTPNHRQVQVVDANSILEWFQQNWDLLCEDEQKVIGFRVYGFPIFIEDETIPIPKTLKELEEVLSSKVYLNDLIVKKDHIVGMTDDDEIMLAWAIFTEEYANKHPELTAIWLQDNIPTNVHSEPFQENVKGIEVKEKGTENCRVYYMATAIYDSGHFEYLTKPVVFNGVSLPNLPKFLAEKPSLNIKSNDYYRKDEVLSLQQFAKLLKNDNQLSDLYQTFSKFGLEELNSDTYEKDISKVITKEYIQRGVIDPKTQCRISNHFIEISIHWSDCYDYIVLFDDYWYNQHPTLAKSLINFHQKAMLNKNWE